jgi:hypothetical protein
MECSLPIKRDAGIDRQILRQSVSAFTAMAVDWRNCERCFTMRLLPRSFFAILRVHGADGWVSLRVKQAAAGKFSVPEHHGHLVACTLSHN